jgi:hypothetical protein
MPTASQKPKGYGMGVEPIAGRMRCGPPIPAVHLQEAEIPATTTVIKLALAVTGGADPRGKYHCSTSLLTKAFRRSRTAVLMAMPTPARDAKNPAAGLTMASLHS